MGKKIILGWIMVIFFLSFITCGPTVKPKEDAGGGCGENEKYCNGICVNIKTDPDNCGDCGKKCASGEVCENGSCKTQNCAETCTGNNMRCCGERCVNIMTDNNNCGECGRQCSSDEVCTNGRCEPTSLCTPPCSAGQECCRGRCVDPNTAYDNDIRNCGFCGNECDLKVADRCLNGQCSCGDRTACGSGFKCCNIGGVVACRSVTSDPNNCGDCGHKCNPGENCVNGECKCNNGPPCNPGEACCKDGCRNVMNDPNNCGGCNIICDPVTSDRCVNGQCKCGTNDPCVIGFGGMELDILIQMFGCVLSGTLGSLLYNICCSGQCMPMDSNNCGECGRRCSSGEECQGTFFEPPLVDGGYLVDGGFMDPNSFFKCQFDCYPSQ